MTIVEKIENTLEEFKNTEEEKYEIFYDLWKNIKEVVSEAKEHLGLISEQMRHYDKHDHTHSQKVIENIEKILGEDGIKRLTIMEAFMIYLSGYLHDTGMALPDWFFSLLKTVENQNYVFHDEEIYYSDIKAEINKNKSKLYKDFSEIHKLFLCPDTEKELIDYMIFEVYQYEQYRCGYKEQLDNLFQKSKDEYDIYSEQLRAEYLRITHGERSAKYIRCIWKKLASAIREANARKLSESLAKICNAHCQDFRVVQEMKYKENILRDEYYNEQYLAVLLRLGDVIHFCEDRAPYALYLERTEMSPVSAEHWLVKAQDLNYYFERRGEELHVIFSAYCKDPNLYYFLDNYLDWIDDEIFNYYIFIREMESSMPVDYKQYKLPLAIKVEREIGCDPSFKPDTDLEFKLNQKKIIQLLMGVQLYKDEFMCLREVYQNALDACKSMHAYYQKKGITYRQKIEFGIGNDEGGKYIYCHDNGIGMTTHIIKNYLLNIGNSYYTSKEFKIQNYMWDNKVNAISMFGVGILSCYMIGDKMEIITKHYSGKEDICCICMYGMKDYGFFREVTHEEREIIKDHGTIIKIYLNEKFEDEINDYIPDHIDDMIFLCNTFEKEKNMNGKTDFFENYTENEKKNFFQFRHSLYYRISNIVYIPDKNVDIYICRESEKEQMISHTQIFSLEKVICLLPNNELRLDRIIFNQYKMDRLGELHGKIKKKGVPDYVKIFKEWSRKYISLVCSVENQEMELYTILSLPKEPIDKETIIVDNLADMFVGGLSGGYCIDGLSVEGIFLLYDNRQKQFYDKDIFYNYIGSKRPELSVDRKTIISFSDELGRKKQNSKQQLLYKVADTITSHISKYGLQNYQYTVDMIIEYLLAKYEFSDCFVIIKRLAMSMPVAYSICGIQLKDMFTEKNFVVKDSVLYLWKGNKIWMENLLLQAKSIMVEGDKVKILLDSKDEFKCLDSLGEYTISAICTSGWKGKYEEYDMVKALWPLVPTRFFERLSLDEEIIDDKIKVFMSYEYEDSIKYLVLQSTTWGENIFLDSSICRSTVLLYLKNGIPMKYSLGSLFEETNTNKRTVIYLFINPNELSDEEKNAITVFKDNEEFMRGVNEGWSVLLYRYNDECIVAPGIVPREEMIKRIPDYAKQHDDGIEYIFTDGTKAF